MESVLHCVKQAPGWIYGSKECVKGKETEKAGGAGDTEMRGVCIVHLCRCGLKRFVEPV